MLKLLEVLIQLHDHFGSRAAVESHCVKLKGVGDI